ncbi:MAG: GatB/YqeY domain-containing protein [Chloroflexi bacterium]|nr:GatB/YqeY domain-containing protein [Chloroflexota bacterium]
MNLKERLLADLYTAMRQQDLQRRDHIRFLRSIIANAEIEWQREATDQDVQVLISREVRQREEAIEIYRQAGRQDLVSQEEAAIAVLSDYLPEQASPDAVRQVVQRIITELGASGMKDMGAVMKRAMSELRGKADGSLVNQIARDLLT